MGHWVTRPLDVVGYIGCAGLLIGIPVVIIMGLYTDWRALAGLALSGLLVFAVLKKFSKEDKAKTATRKEQILGKLRPGVSFKAHGSAGTPMEGVCYRVIDDHTIEASVGYADQPGRRERGPFPISNIDSVGGDD